MSGRVAKTARQRAASRRSSKRPSASHALHIVEPAEIDPTDLKNPALYINRELSWLAFNQRVLDQALDASYPLLERVKFLAIAATNLDEFFMIRISTTQKKLAEGIEDIAPDGLSTEAQLVAMRRGAVQMLQRLTDCWEQLRALLSAERVRLLDEQDWTPRIRDYLSDQFSRDIYPVLTPLAFDPGHPFPLVSNGSQNFAVVVRHGGRIKFARVKVPDVLPRFVPVPESVCRASGPTFVFLEDVIKANMHELFPGTQVKGSYVFRIIRDTDLEIEQDEADDLLETIESSLQELRHGAVALLRVGSDMPTRVLKILIENFETTDEVVDRTSARLGFGDWMELTKIHRPELKDPPFSQAALWRVDEDPEVIFDQIRYQDHLVHHPYESFGSVEAFLRAAVRDPHVVAIKMTLYRIGANSPLIDLLIEAAESGKQVAVLVELKARFDERNNIIWARQLEAHGIHVVYGFPHLKTHAKLCLVVRKEPDGIQMYVHTATGNYNPDTAKVYTDFGLFTADHDIASDVSEVFNSLTGYSNQKTFRRLLVGPVQLRARLADLIAREAEHSRAGRKAQVIMKINAITDDRMIRELYMASQAGVSMDLLVRGICCLRPGVPGVSDNIRVRSIVGRFLEHTRVYWFLNGGDEEIYIGSADLMERNLDRRVETLCPVLDPALTENLRSVVLDSYIRDSDRAQILDSAGRYTRPDTESDRFSAQTFLLNHYNDATWG